MAPNNESQAIRVSVLENQLLLQDALSRCLQANGMTVVGSHSQPAAFLARLEVELPSVAVLGVLLPWVARDLVKRLLELHPAQKTILLTSTSQPSAVKACLDAGASAVVDRFATDCERLFDIIGEVAAAPFGPIRRPVVREAEPTADALSNLSRRELEVLAHLSSGYDNLKIASLLGISEHTVKVHVGRLYRKLGRENRIEMALLARDLGLGLTV